MSGFVFQKVITAGTTLIRQAIRSANYVAGVSGWSINQDGSAEFNNVTVRGSLSANNGNVLVNDNGLEVDTTGRKMLVDSSGVSVQDSTQPAFTSYAQINIFAQPNETGGVVAVGAPVSTQYPTVKISPGQVNAARTMTGIVARPRMTLQAPKINAPTARGAAQIVMTSESDTGGDGTEIDINADLTTTFNDLIVNGSITSQNIFAGVISVPGGSGSVTNAILNYGRTLKGTVFFASVTPVTALIGPTNVSQWSYINATSTSIQVNAFIQTATARNFAVLVIGV